MHDSTGKWSFWRTASPLSDAWDQLGILCLLWNLQGRPSISTKTQRSQVRFSAISIPGIYGCFKRPLVAAGKWIPVAKCHTTRTGLGSVTNHSCKTIFNPRPFNVVVKQNPHQIDVSINRPTGEIEPPKISLQVPTRVLRPVWFYFNFDIKGRMSSFIPF